MVTKNTQKTPREKRHDLTRQKILDMARKILVTQGLAGLSMRALAEKIEYSPAAIYKYFENKEEILQAIRDEGWALSRLSNPDKKGLTPPEKLLAGGRYYLAFADSYPEHYLLMFNSPDLDEGGVSGMSIDPRFTGLLTVIEEGIVNGYFKLPAGLSPVHMAYQLWISCHGIVMLRLTKMRQHRAEFDLLCDQIMKGFVDSITVK
jgi:AcrR family transcriptional regulator